MKEVDYNGTIYKNPDCLSLKALAAMDIYTFRYFPKDKMIINSDLTMEAYHCKQIYTDMPCSFIDEFVDDAYRDAYAGMYEDIDAGAAQSSVTFSMKNQKVCKVTLVPASYDEEGQLEAVDGMIEDVAEIVAREKENNRRMETLNTRLRLSLEQQRASSERLRAKLSAEREHASIIGGLSSIYFAIYQIDFGDQTFRELRTKENVHTVLGSRGNAKAALSSMVDNLVRPETQDVMRAFNELSTMPDRLARRQIISQEFIGVTTGWARASVIPTEYDQDGRAVKALYCTNSIAHEKEKLDAQSNLINALVAPYQNVYVVNMNTHEAVAYRMSSAMDLRYGQSFATGNYEHNIAVYIEHEVMEEDWELFESVRTVAEIEQQLAETGGFSFTYRIFRGGQKRYFQCQVIKPTDDRREFIIAFKDVDRETQGELRHIRTIQEQLGIIQALSDKYDSVFLVDTAEGRVVPYRLSSRIEHAYGAQLANLENTQMWDQLLEDYANRFVHADYVEEMKQKCSLKCVLQELGGKSAFVYEYKNSHDGEARYCQFKAARMMDGQDARIIIGFSDVNEEREKQLAIQMALKDAYDAATAASRAKTDFLANMSHDIRTPMNGIIGMTAIAGTHIDDQERVRDCLKKITAASKHLLSLINEVLDMSKIESGTIDMAEEEFRLSDLIDNLLTMERPLIEGHHHELIVNIRNVEHEDVIGDSLRIQQMFVNLMSNAIKYTPDGGRIKLSITEKPTNQHRVGCYEVIFEDNGIGMSEAFMEKLFEPFARARDERIRNVQGTGLGMAITRNIVRMMGGNIEVESHLDRGTKFTVTFFLKLQDTEEICENDFIDLPVLVADDDRISVESACDMLDELGMKTEGVLSGHEAVKCVEERHMQGRDYFAVILDWKMPDMDGVDTAREIRKRVGEEVPIIIISAYDWSAIEQEARKAGVSAFISKPLFKSRLAHLFHMLVGKEEQIPEGVPLHEFENMDLTGRRVLLAEDNILNAEIATEILSMTGLTVDQADDGSEAVDMIRDRGDFRYDLVLMDIQMPRMNGYDAARAIRNLGSDYCRTVPIIAMTANAFAEDVQAAFSAGMNEHIAKPLDMKALAGVLKRWVLPKQQTVLTDV